MKVLKKITSAFLATTLILSSVSNSIFAGGKDGVEILEDGTKLTWIPTEKIEQKAKEYAKELEEIKKKELSSSERFLIGFAATAAGVASIVGLQYAKNKTNNPVLSYLCLGVQVLSAAGILASYIVPKVHNHNVFHEIRGNYESERSSPSCCLFDYMLNGIKHRDLCETNGGAEEKSKRLNRIIGWDKSLNKDYRKVYENGIVVVERPKGFKTTLFHRAYGSGIYSQEEWKRRSAFYYELLEKEGVK